jgi:hypothetical protein
MWEDVARVSVVDIDRFLILFHASDSYCSGSKTGTLLSKDHDEMRQTAAIPFLLSLQYVWQHNQGATSTLRTFNPDLVPKPSVRVALS